MANITRRLFWVLSLVGCWLVACTGDFGEPQPGSNGPGCPDAVTCAAGEICDLGACRPSTDGCSSGRALCGTNCVDTQSTSAHCGACDRACSATQVCAAGACTCPAGTTTCGADCAILTSDAAHCGTCGTACTGGRTCQQGTCVCPANQILCGASCADTQTDVANCGTCGTACTGGQVCTAGACVCPAGQLRCGDACIDVQSDDQNCGACAQACSLGQTCSAGACGGGGGPREDGCSGLAQGLGISSLLLYQTVEIPLMREGAEVAAAARNTDVVAGRDALLRVMVGVGAGWGARELSARVFLQNASGVEMLFAKRTVTGSSEAATLDTSFQIPIPKAQLTATTRYAVEIVECGGTPSGAPERPRFPAEDGLALGARQTGPLKIRILPLRVGTLLPDTTEAGLAPYRALMEALYPVSALEFTVAEPLDIAEATDWSGNLDRVRARRQSDAPAADVYYYGLIKPAATLREFCGGSCTTGIGYVPQGNGNNQSSQRASMGIGFADNASAETMGHEIGHNHGREHAPCGGVSGADENFPDPEGRIGVYGYDTRSSRLVAPDRTDLMGYCQNKWLSAYTYDGILNRVVTVNGAPLAVLEDPSLRRAYRILLVDDRGPRWGIPLTAPASPAGAAEPAEVLDSLGRVIASITVYRTRIADIGASSIEVPPPEAGWHSVRVAGASAYPFGAPTLVPSP